MKSKFFYPTKKNVCIGFFIAQLLPFITLGLNNNLNNPILWLHFELVIIGCLSLWQIKPFSELDEREKEIILKWKSRILDYGSVVVLLPIIILSFRPEVSGWILFNFMAIPVFIVFVVCTLMTKKELGYYFYKEN